MDIETLLKVIEMLDNNLESTKEEDVKLYYSFSEAEYKMLGRRSALEDFRDYLQGYIENQVSKVEG